MSVLVNDFRVMEKQKNRNKPRFLVHDEVQIKKNGLTRRKGKIRKSTIQISKTRQKIVFNK